MKRYKVHVGTDSRGYNRYMHFNTMDAAVAFCSAVFRAKGIVLSIVEDN